MEADPQFQTMLRLHAALIRPNVRCASSGLFELPIHPFPTMSPYGLLSRVKDCMEKNTAANIHSCVLSIDSFANSQNPNLITSISFAFCSKNLHITVICLSYGGKSHPFSAPDSLTSSTHLVHRVQTYTLLHHVDVQVALTMDLRPTPMATLKGVGSNDTSSRSPAR
jgi:hypothetical protein